MEKIREFVLEEIQKKYTIDAGVDVDSLNYVDEGYVDSLGLVQFVIGIEDEFGIEFTDEDMESAEFKVVGSLIEMIQRKISQLD